MAKPSIIAKKPPAPSATRRHGITADIATELYIALEGLGADKELLSIIGSYGDTLPDDQVLELLRRYNSGRSTL